MASDANNVGWGGHTIEDVPIYVREHFSEEEISQSSTHRELLGMYMCLHTMVHLCAGKMVLFHVDARNLLGVVIAADCGRALMSSRGSSSDFAWSVGL